MSLTPEQMADLRQQVLQGKQLDLDTARAVVEQLRGNRLTAAEAASKSKQKRKAKGMTDEQLDADLDQFLTAKPGDSAPDLQLDLPADN